MANPALTLAIINKFAPKHTVLRYQDEVVCTDENRRGGFRFEFLAKEWRCKRCCLLDILDDRAPDDVELSLEVYDVGNVK